MFIVKLLILFYCVKLCFDKPQKLFIHTYQGNKVDTNNENLTAQQQILLDGYINAIVGRENVHISLTSSVIILSIYVFK